MRLEIVANVPPSLNRTLRMHWRKRAQLQNDWGWFIHLALRRRDQCYLQPIVKMQAKITLHHSRQYDKDNAYGAAKVVVDALKHWKLIFDDSPEYLDLEVQQEKCARKVSKTVIELVPA